MNARMCAIFFIFDILDDCFLFDIGI